MQAYGNPGVGRFTRRDTYEGSLKDPMSLHNYLYTHANPVNFTDPTGLYTLGEHQAAVSIANTLAGIQWESGQYLIGATLGDKDADNPSRFLIELAVVGIGGSLAVGIAASRIRRLRPQLRFGERDLVYGVTTSGNNFGLVRKFQQKGGGGLILDDFLGGAGPGGRQWIEVSIDAMETTIRRVNKVHFDLT